MVGATVVRYSFGVGLFHSFLHAGLSRRSQTTAPERRRDRASRKRRTASMSRAKDSVDGFWNALSSASGRQRIVSAPVFLAVDSATADLTADDRVLADAIRAAGAEVVPVVWGAEVPRHGTLVIRLTWGYVDDPNRFVTWLGRLTPTCRCLQPDVVAALESAQALPD